MSKITDASMNPPSSYFLWPEIFDTGVVPDANSERDKLLLISYAYQAWGIVAAGGKPHENFGKVMAQMSIKLGMSVRPDALDAFMEARGIDS